MSSYWYWAGLCCLFVLSSADGACAANGLTTEGMPGAHVQTSFIKQAKALHIHSRVLMDAGDGKTKDSSVSARSGVSARSSPSLRGAGGGQGSKSRPSGPGSAAALQYVRPH